MLFFREMFHFRELKIQNFFLTFAAQWHSLSVPYTPLEMTCGRQPPVSSNEVMGHAQVSEALPTAMQPTDYPKEDSKRD